MLRIISCAAGKSNKPRHKTSQSNETSAHNNRVATNNGPSNGHQSHKNTSARNEETLQNQVDSNYANDIIARPPDAGLAIRYVTAEFRAGAEDELTVMPGEVVFHWFTDKDENGEWSHVSCLKNNQRGYVPSDILSLEPPPNQFKKKLPRTARNSPKKQPMHTMLSHPVCNEPPFHTMQPHLSHHDHDIHQAKFFNTPGSMQGSSAGHRSVHKYMADMHQFNPPAYCNVKTTEQHSDEFRREHLGQFVVTNNFVAREENDLNVKPGDIVEVLNKDDRDWYWVRRDDYSEGFVPSRFILDYEEVRAILNKGNSTVTMKSSNQNDFHTYINHRPDKESQATDQQSLIFPNI